MPDVPLPAQSGSGGSVSLRRRYGRWLERRDRCCNCARSLKRTGGMHAFGFWFYPRHTNAKVMGKWSDV